MEICGRMKPQVIRVRRVDKQLDSRLTFDGKTLVEKNNHTGGGRVLYGGMASRCDRSSITM